MKLHLKISVLFLFGIISGNCLSQQQDMTVIVQEASLNKLFKAIGEIKGTSQYSFMFMEGTYEWSLLNPQIKLHPNHADFISDVKVTVGKYNYTMHVTGNVEVCYEPTTNLLYIEITEASFPLNIMFFGKLRHLWDVNLARYFVTPFTFEGPLTVGTTIVFDMPDNSQKIIYTHPLNCGVKIVEKQIIVSAEMEFVSRPIVPVLQKLNNH